MFIPTVSLMKRTNQLQASPHAVLCNHARSRLGSLKGISEYQIELAVSNTIS